MTTPEILQRLTTGMDALVGFCRRWKMARLWLFGSGLSWSGFGGTLHGRSRHPICQSSICKPSTRSNSAVLCVTRVTSFARAMDAISKSSGPMRAPRRAS